MSVLPEPENVVEFASIVVESPARKPPVVKEVSRVESVVALVTIGLKKARLLSGSPTSSMAR